MLEHLLILGSKSHSVKRKTTLTSSNPRNNARYGKKVAFTDDGNTLIVTEPGGYVTTANNSGVFYVYKKDGSGNYIQSQKLGASGNPANIYLGDAMSASQNCHRLAIGAISDTGRVANTGAAYVFEETNGVYAQKAKLISNDGIDSDQFGIATTITKNGNRVIVGACYRDDRGSNSGAAYVYDYNGTTYVQSQKLLPDSGTNNGWFGTNLGVSDDGVYLAVQTYSTNGTIYVYRHNGTSYVQIAKFVNPVAVSSSFGIAFFFTPDNTELYIGAPGGSIQSVYKYTVSETAVTYASVITPLDPQASSFGASFGYAAESGKLMVGAYGLNNSNGGFYGMSVTDTTLVEDFVYTSITGPAKGTLGLSIATSANGSIVAAGGPNYVANGFTNQTGCVELITID